MVRDHLFQSCWSSDASATSSQPLAIGSSSHSHQENTKDSGTTEGMSSCSDFFHSSSITIPQGSSAESGDRDAPNPCCDIKEVQTQIVEISLISSILLSSRKNHPLAKVKEGLFVTSFVIFGK